MFAHSLEKILGLNQYYLMILYFLEKHDVASATSLFEAVQEVTSDQLLRRLAIWMKPRMPSKSKLYVMLVKLPHLPDYAISVCINL